MSAQDKLPAQTYISSPQNFQPSFIKQGGYALPATQSLTFKPVQIPIPILQDRTTFVPVSKRGVRKLNRQIAHT